MHKIEKIKQFYGERAGKRAIAWHDLIQKSQHLTDLQKLKAVNDFFNQFIFISDQNYGERKTIGQHLTNLLVQELVIVRILVLLNIRHY